MMRLIHGNKHLTADDVRKSREKMLENLLIKDPDTQLKRYEPVSMWKITILDMRSAGRFEAVLTERDLTQYFECQVFEFYRKH